MPITSVTTDPSSLTMTVVAEFPVPLRRLWDAYADPRQLERFWGPVEWPARFLRHDMTPGGESHYVMTGPDGTTSAGFWRFLAVEEGASFEVVDGFATEPGVPGTSMPTMRLRFEFGSTAEGSRVITTTWFDSLEDMETVLAHGAEEGMRSAMGQMDDVLADLAGFAADTGTHAQHLDDTRVRVSRVIRGSVEQVWRAHHEPDLVRRWMLGPDGWTMPRCETATEPGQTYTYAWEHAESGERFGFTGELVQAQAPVRAVTTERMLGTDGPQVRNEMTLTPLESGTLLTLVITYPSRELRDQILGTGMTDGMETSYARLEQEVLVGA